MVLCCCNERQIASLLRLGGERGGDCLQRRPHLHCITSSQLRSCGGFNCFTAAAATALLGEEQSQATHSNRHILRVYVKIPHAKLPSPFLDRDFRTVLQLLGIVRHDWNAREPSCSHSLSPLCDQQSGQHISSFLHLLKLFRERKVQSRSELRNCMSGKSISPSGPQTSDLSAPLNAFLRKPSVWGSRPWSSPTPSSFSSIHSSWLVCYSRTSLPGDEIPEFPADPREQRREHVLFL